MKIGTMSSAINGGTVDDVIAEAKWAKDFGMHTFWSSQIFGHDALTALAVVGREVTGLELGTAVVPTYPRHPWVMAQQALTVQAFTDGRLCLGLGLSHQFVVEYLWGLSFDKPLRHMREYLSVLMPLLSGENVDFEGETMTVRGSIGIAGSSRPSVVIAALGEQMLRLAGTVTDGTSTWCTGPQTLADLTIPTIRQAAADASRPDPRVVAALPVCVTEDVDGVKAVVAEMLSVYNTLPSYRAMMDREGVAGPADLTIAGSESTVRDQLTHLRSIGVTDFNAVQVGRNPDERSRTNAVLAEFL